MFDSYGKKCNSRFLLNYGFAVDHNADDDVGQNHNEVRLLIALLPPAEDPWHARRNELLGGLALLQPPHDAAVAAAAAAGAGISAGSGVGAGASRLSAKPSHAGDLQLGGGGGGGGGAAWPGPASASNVAALDVASGGGAQAHAHSLFQAQGPARAVRISTFAEYDGTVEAFSFLRFVHARGGAFPTAALAFCLSLRPRSQQRASALQGRRASASITHVAPLTIAPVSFPLSSSLPPRRRAAAAAAHGRGL